MNLAIKNGRLLDPSQDLDGNYDLLIKDGRVTEIAPKGKLQSGADEVIDAAGLIVSPGRRGRPAAPTAPRPAAAAAPA